MSGSGINASIPLNTAGTNALAAGQQNPVQQIGQFAQAAKGVMALRNGQVSPMGAMLAGSGNGGTMQTLQNIGQMQMLQNGIRIPSGYTSPFGGQSDSPWSSPAATASASPFGGGA